MNYVEYFEVEGFWGNKRVCLNLNEDLNFLIGTNGSGKTTIINLLSAVLRADISSLYSIQFKQAFIRLKAAGSNIKPIIIVSKIIDEEKNSFKLQYTVKEKTSAKGIQYVVEGPFDERIYHDPRYAKTRRLREEGARLNSILSDIVEVNWLSVHRSPQETTKQRYREEEVEQSVDTKIKEISRAFSNYFSLLSTTAEKESKSFQEQVFLSLLEPERSPATIAADMNQEPPEKSTVVGFLTELGVASSKANKSATDHLSRVDDAKSSFYRDESDFKMHHAVALSDASRVNDIIRKWRHLQETRNRIFSPRDKFQSIINSLYVGKKLSIDARNEPKILLDNDEMVEVAVLSSGEKQLFILLGEALLQEDKPVVFISDEPELSLHVTWQSTLFRNIRLLNSSCQIISATHSPDIVGAFKDKIIKINDCFH